MGIVCAHGNSRHTSRKGKAYRNLTPLFDMPKTELRKRGVDQVIQRAQQHNFMRDEDYRKIRYHGAVIQRGHREIVLKARIQNPHPAKIEALEAVTQALLYHCNMNPTGDHLFEVFASIEDIAATAGALHHYRPDEKYTHGRKTCHPVRAAINELEACERIIIVSEWDSDKRNYKSSRLFLTPKFFMALGLDLKAIRKMLIRHCKTHKATKEQLEHQLQRQIKTRRIAEIKCPKTKQKLSSFKRLIFPLGQMAVTGEKDGIQRRQRHFERLLTTQTVDQLGTRLLKEALRIKALCEHHGDIKKELLSRQRQSKVDDATLELTAFIEMHSVSGVTLKRLEREARTLQKEKQLTHTEYIQELLRRLKLTLN